MNNKELVKTDKRCRVCNKLMDFHEGSDYSDSGYVCLECDIERDLKVNEYKYYQYGNIL